MQITIRKLDAHESPQTTSFLRKFTVSSRLVLAIEDEELVYSIVPVEPYERDIPAEDVDYGFNEEAPTVFFAGADGRLAGRIKMLSGFRSRWNTRSSWAVCTP